MFSIILKFVFSIFFLDIERYSKRYMKVYKEEWIPGNCKTENVKIIFKGYLPTPYFLGQILYFHRRKIESGSFPIIN